MRLIESLKKKKFTLFNIFFTLYIGINLIGGERGLISYIEKKKNYESIIGFFEILDKKNKIINLQPEIRIYNEPEMATSEASIKTTLFKDRFITINIIKDQNFFNVRYQHKPFMIWIWISTLIIIMGGMFAIFRKNKEVNI